jgi:hypothetical protein
LNLTLKILGPATIIFLLALIDDFWGVSAYAKFAVQAGAAALLFWNGFGISRLSLLAGYPHLGWLVGLPLTIVWVLWITNAFNLIDGVSPTGNIAGTEDVGAPSGATTGLATNATYTVSSTPTNGRRTIAGSIGGNAIMYTVSPSKFLVVSLSDLNPAVLIFEQ